MRVRIADAHTLLTATLTFMVLPVTLRALLAHIILRAAVAG